MIGGRDDGRVELEGGKGVDRREDVVVGHVRVVEHFTNEVNAVEKSISVRPSAEPESDAHIA